MAEVTIVEARKAYGSLEVLHGVNVDVADGEFVVLVGPSGCGKSTLLRMVAGLEAITGGEISIGNRVINDVHPKDRDIAMVFQNYALYPHMTVGENIGFPLKMAGMNKDEIGGRVASAAETLGLTGYLHRHPRHLSGGQRQRVAMGRAIVRRPKAFLFDEPLSNLDAKLRVQMRAELKELHYRMGTTSIYVTHDQVEAMTMADRIVVMRDGVIEQTGTPLELYDRPANIFVAGFIGSPAINLIPATIDREHRQVRIADAFALDIAGRYDLTRIPDAVTCGIRPEHLSVSRTAEGISARVTVVEPTGAQTQLLSRAADGTDLVLITNDRLDLRPDEDVRLTCDAAVIALFDPLSALRIRPRAETTSGHLGWM